MEGMKKIIVQRPGGTGYTPLEILPSTSAEQIIDLARSSLGLEKNATYHLVTQAGNEVNADPFNQLESGAVLTIVNHTEGGA